MRYLWPYSQDGSLHTSTYESNRRGLLAYNLISECIGKVAFLQRRMKQQPTCHESCISNQRLSCSEGLVVNKGGGGGGGTRRGHFFGLELFTSPSFLTKEKTVGNTLYVCPGCPAASLIFLWSIPSQ